MVALVCGVVVGCGGSGAGSTLDASGGAKVSGTLTLPAANPGKPYTVKLFTMAGRASLMATTETSGLTAATPSVAYAIATVPAGTYFVLGFVDVDGSGGTASTAGDFAGWYGHTGDGNPPGTANAVVPATGNATFDFALVVR